MPTDLVTLKIDREFLKEIDATAKKNNYHSRTEFVREALRTKLDEIRLKNNIAAVKNLRGSWKGPALTPEEYERNRRRAAKEASRAVHKSSGR